MKIRSGRPPLRSGRAVVGRPQRARPEVEPARPRRGGWRRGQGRCRGCRARLPGRCRSRPGRSPGASRDRHVAAASRTVPSPPIATINGASASPRGPRASPRARPPRSPGRVRSGARTRTARPRRRSARAVAGSIIPDARGFTRMRAPAVARSWGHGPMLPRTGCGIVARHSVIAARLRLANRPPGHTGTRKTRKPPARTAFPSPLSDDVPRVGTPLNPAPPVRHVLPCAPAGATARRAPSATSWQEGAPLRTLHLGARAFIPVALAGAVLFSLAPSTPAAASTTTEAQQIIRIAERSSAIRGATAPAGPYRFDCSGLVHLRLPAGRRRARDPSLPALGPRALLLLQGPRLASRTNPRIGDLVDLGRRHPCRDLHRQRQGDQHADQRRPDPWRLRGDRPVHGLSAHRDVEPSRRS